MKEDIDHGFQSKNKHCTREIHCIKKKIGQLFSIITVIILKVIETVFKLPSWKGQGTTECQRGQHRLEGAGEGQS